VADIYRSIEAEIPRLRRYARALARDVAAADDLVQDCLARALGKLHLWQEGTDLRAWLFTILHNQYVNQVRRAVREGAAVGLSETEPMLTRAPHQGKRLELRDLERAIAKLPEEQRSVILLMGIVPDRQAEIIMAEPAALHRATQRFPGKAAYSAINTETRCAMQPRPANASAKPAAGTMLN
jgi:RNA polymerase sigma factor (sigma-70 family)